MLQADEVDTGSEGRYIHSEFIAPAAQADVLAGGALTEDIIDAQPAAAE